MLEGKQMHTPVFKLDTGVHKGRDKSGKCNHILVKTLKGNSSNFTSQSKLGGHGENYLFCFPRFHIMIITPDGFGELLAPGLGLETGAVS